MKSKWPISCSYDCCLNYISSHWYAAVICNLPSIDQAPIETPSHSAAITRTTQARPSSANTEILPIDNISSLATRSESEDALPRRTAQMSLEDEPNDKDAPIVQPAEVSEIRQCERQLQNRLSRANSDGEDSVLLKSGPNGSTASQSSLQEESVTGLLPPISANVTPLSQKTRRKAGTLGRKYNPEE
jgi:hypothetical protein